MTQTWTWSVYAVRPYNVMYTGLPCKQFLCELVGEGMQMTIHWLSLGSDPSGGLRDNSVGTSTHPGGTCDEHVGANEPQNLCLAKPHSPFVTELQRYKHMFPMPVWCSYMSCLPSGVGSL